MAKLCEVCDKEIPEDYQNLLCDECYKKVEIENQQVEQIEKESIKFNSGITDPNYRENPQMEDKEQWMANMAIFQHNEVLLWKPTRQMYSFIKEYFVKKIMAHPQYPKFIWKPKVVDVGTGSGVGANVLSQESDFVWGIDKNATSIKFAKEAFERVKNNIYYSSQLTFDNIDIMEDTRDFMKFDYIVAIEVIEHIANHRMFLENLIRKFDKRKAGYETTEYFISTPNRNNRTINKEKPKNPYHVKEFTQEEYIAVLSEFFNNVEMLTAEGKPIGERNDHTPLLARCSEPKI